MTVNPKSNESPRTAGAGDDARRELRRFFLLGPAEPAEAGEPRVSETPAVVPVPLAAFVGAGRVRTDYPLYLGSTAPTGSLEAATGAHGALCLGFDELISRARRTLDGEGAPVGQMLRDNLKRLEGHLLDLLEAGTATGDAQEALRAAGAAMAEALAAESGLAEADRAALVADVERLAAALPPAGDGPGSSPARFLAPRTGVSLDLLGHALLAGRRTTRESFLREARELVDKGRALIDADRRKRADGDAGRDGERERGAMGAMGKRFVDPSALASVLGERRGTTALAPARRERLEAAIEALAEVADRLAEVADRLAAPRMRLIHDGSLPWGERLLGAAESDNWVVVESSDPCAAAAEVFDREAEALAAALRGRERVRLETSGTYVAADHEPWLERLAGFDWRAFDAGEAALLEPTVALESAGELAERGMLSLSKLLRSSRPVQVLVALDPAMSPGVENPAAGYRFEPGYLGMSHREAFVQQSSEARPLHLMEGLVRAASSSRTSLHVVAPWPGQVEAGLDPALVAGAAIDGRAHPLFRYDPETGPSWAHRLDFSGNPQPAADWPTDDGADESPFTFADFALLDPALRRHVTPIGPGAADDADLVPIAAWLALPVDEAIHKIPTVLAVPVTALGNGSKGPKGGQTAPAEPVRLAVSRPLAAACRDRLGFWRTLQELAGVNSEYVRRAAQATREEAEQAARAERERLEAAHAAELERVRERSAREAVDRLTAALLEVDLGLFSELPPEIPSLAGKTADQVAAALMDAVGSDLAEMAETVETIAAGDGAPSSEAVDAAARQLLELVDPAAIDRELTDSLEHTTE